MLSPCLQVKDQPAGFSASRKRRLCFDAEGLPHGSYSRPRPFEAMRGWDNAYSRVQFPIDGLAGVLIGDREYFHERLVPGRGWMAGSNEGSRAEH